MSKGRTPPPAVVDHAAQWRDRLGRAAYEAAFDHEPVPWPDADEARRERYRKIGQAVLEVFTTHRRGVAGRFEVGSLYSSQTSEPMVEIAMGRSPTQMTPAKAREIALMILEAADAAESDALVASFGRDRIGLDQIGVAQLLDQFRRERERLRGEKVDAA